MEVKIYKCTAENRHVDKTEYLTEVATMEGALRQKSVSVVDPVIEVAYNEDIFSCNYVYIKEFKRYYYISEFSNVVNGIVALSLHVDVLYSFKDQFLQNSGYVDTSLNYANFYLNDPNTPIQQNSDLFTVKTFDSPFNGSSIIMNCLNTTHRINEE